MRRPPKDKISEGVTSSNSVVRLTRPALSSGYAWTPKTIPEKIWARGEKVGCQNSAVEWKRGEYLQKKAKCKGGKKKGKQCCSEKKLERNERVEQ